MSMVLKLRVDMGGVFERPVEGEAGHLNSPASS